jgi:hypothetical protein
MAKKEKTGNVVVQVPQAPLKRSNKEYKKYKEYKTNVLYRLRTKAFDFSTFAIKAIVLYY